MKKKTMNLNRKLMFSKETVAALNGSQKQKVRGGGLVATYEDNCRTLGLGIDLTKCCPVYQISVNISCNA